MKRLLFFLILLVAVPLHAQTKRAMTFEDLIGMERLSDPQTSPDGKVVAFVITKYSTSTNSSNSNIYVVSTEGGTVRQLTVAPRHNRSPRWMPDGKTLAFVSSRDGESQIWTIRADGGEAQKVSAISTGASGLMVARNGQSFLFTSEVFPDCPTDDCNKKRNEEIQKSKVKAKVFTSLPYRVWNYWKDGKRSHVFILPTKGGEARDLTPGDFDSPPIDLGGSQDYDISPDGREVVFTRNEDPFVAVSTNNDLFVVPAGGGPISKITENPANDNQPVYSPDGKYIAYRKMDRPGFEADRQQLLLYDRATGRRVNLTSDFDKSVGAVSWSPDSKFLYFTADHHGNHAIYRIPTGGGAVETILESGTNRNLSITPDGKTVVFLRQTTTMPAEIYAIDSDGEDLRALTQVNSQRLSGLEMNPVEAFWFEGAGNTRLHGWLVKPPFFDSSRKYPMIYLLHGGPQGQWADQFHYRWNAQMFASRGYVVAMVNRRGSTGFGQQFTDEITGDWGGRAYEDLMKGLDFLVTTYRFIDEAKIAAAGASYGGYMANWMAGMTGRFTCIVSHDGVYNPYSMYGTTEELWFPEWEFGGTPYAHPELYERWSPLRKASNFKTPMLVIHGQLDYRVDVSEGFQLFTALQRQGVKSKMLYFPDEGHFVVKPQNAQLWWKTVLDWIDEHTR
jgi:dipeptidyl aminopeptidase/acylaminoacyl peptidase